MHKKSAPEGAQVFKRWEKKFLWSRSDQDFGQLR